MASSRIITGTTTRTRSERGSRLSRPRAVLRPAGGCGAAGGAAPDGGKAPARPLGCIAIGGDEDILQLLPLHRLLDDGYGGEAAVDALDAIARDEDERDFPRHQHVGDGIDELSSE